MVEKKRDVPQVIRPKRTDAPGEMETGMVCVECGNFHTELNIAWCRACGGMVSLGTRATASSSVQEDRKRRGLA